MNEISLSVLATLTEEILPREVVINENGVYLHTWVVNVFDDHKGSYFRIYLCRKNGIWASVSQASGKTWGYACPLWDGDFKFVSLNDALLDAWQDFDRIEPKFHEKPKFYQHAKNFFDMLILLPDRDKYAYFEIRD